MHPDRTAGEWDGRAEVALAVTMRRYLNENPPPAGSALAGDMVRWADNLHVHGTARLRVVGARPLVLRGDA